MGILSWIILGLIAGALAKLIHPGADPGGWIASLVIGVVGAMLGGFLFGLLGYEGADGVNLWSIVVATVGAIVTLAIYHRLA